jgi:hypothetical protein
MRITNEKPVIALLFCSLFALTLTAQIKERKDLPIAYAMEKDTILKLGKGDVLHVTFDSIYLFNEKRFKDFTDLMKYRDFIQQKDPMAKAFSMVVDNQTKSLDSLEKYINLLKANADSTSKTSEKLAKSTIEIAKAADNKLDGVSQKLTDAQSNLAAANVHLETAVKLIKKDMQLRWLKNVAFVAAGILFGKYVLK